MPPSKERRKNLFLLRDAMHSAAYAMTRLVFVWSVVFMYCIETSKHILKLFHLLRALPFHTKLQDEIVRAHFTGRRIQVGINRFPPISRFISEAIQDTKYRAASLTFLL